ncbi:GBS Bsp-like repeat-containing protein [Enterococcus cecorum]|uniref:GBS Bsp-like repeat-containing protein n=1 Tax=Enterococcus cecorum TaxID=44008 RepID=UPI003F51FA9A
MSLGVCVITLSMLTGIYPASTVNLNNTSVHAEEVQLSIGIVENVNQLDGTFDIIVSPENASDVKSVRVPIWSEKSRKIVWYDAEKQNDGRWVAHFNFKNHDYLRGSYHFHAYIYTVDGKSSSYDLGKVQLEEFQSNVSAKVQNIDTVNGTYDIVIQANSGAGIHHITVPIWSKEDKSDLKNYEAVNENGQWVVHFNKQNHQNHIGIYHYVVEVYFNDHTGKRISMENVEIKGESLTLEGNIVNINSVNGSYDVVINASAPSGVKSVRVPIWTNAKDIKWYEAKKQADGTWTVHMDIKNHNNHLGKYTTHVYMTTNDGRETAKNLRQTEIVGQPLELNGQIINVNSKAGSYDVVINASAPSGVKSVRVPIWTNAKDIKWYQAKKQKDST